MDTWTWNGTTWSQATPATSPSARIAASMAYDPATGNMVLFGGRANNFNPLGDTWTWNGTTWSRVSPAMSPPARYGASMAYDPATGNMVLFGGRANNVNPLGDTWTWNGTTWSQSSPATSPPPASPPRWPMTRPPGTWSSSGGATTTSIHSEIRGRGTARLGATRPRQRVHPPATPPRWPMTRPPGTWSSSGGRQSLPSLRRYLDMGRR